MTLEISTLMDGEATRHETQQTLEGLRHDPEWRRCWDDYHLIGDALRESATVSPDFMAKFSARLEEEPTVLAPRPPRRVPEKPLIAFSAAASVAMLTFAGWAAWQSHQPQPVGNAITVARLALPKTPPPNPNINPYLVAHQEASPGMGMEGVTPYIRTVAQYDR